MPRETWHEHPFVDQDADGTWLETWAWPSLKTLAHPPERANSAGDETSGLTLAHRFEWLLNEGVVKDYAELASLGQVTRARITQIMNLLNLSPEIQEEILFLPPILDGRDLLTERQVRIVLGKTNWSKQHLGFKRVRRGSASE